MSEPRRQGTILLLARDFATGRWIRGWLEALGHRVYLVDRVAAAVALIERGIAFESALIDLDLPDGDGVDLLWLLHERAPQVATVLFGDELDRSAMHEAYRSGVIGSLSTPLQEGPVVRACEQAIQVTRLRRQAEGLPSRREPTPQNADASGPPMREPLTPRERDVLRLLLEGQSTDDMARALGVTPRTVKWHVTNILRKTGTRSRIRLLATLRTTLSPLP